MDLDELLDESRFRDGIPARGVAPTEPHDEVPAATRPRAHWSWSALLQALSTPFRRIVLAMRNTWDGWCEDLEERRSAKQEKPAEPSTVAWRENTGSQMFSFASVGAPLPPFLSGREVKRLADMLGFYRTELAGRQLDIPPTLRAALRGDDPGRIFFQPRLATRQVLILEDALAHRDFRSPLVEELARGFEATGVTVRRGRFRHVVDRWRNERGAVVELDDLENQREGLVALVFTDGSSFTQPAGRTSLECLAAWPRVAWMDLREPRSRIAAADLPRAVGLPLFSATPEGLLAAFTSFLVQGRRVDESADVAALVPSAVEQQLGRELYLEAMLDDAFLWAADCSVFQPCSYALAERLRRRFHADLPRIALQRLLQLPGVQRDAVGIRFDLQTVAVLQTAWQTRHSEARQDEVLRYVDELLREARPVDAPEGSLAHLTWAAGVERVRLGWDADNDFSDLEQILQTPAARWAHNSLAGRYVAGCTAPQPEQIVPVRVAVRDKQALQRLSRIIPGADEPAPPKTSAVPEPIPGEPEMVWLEPDEFVMGSPATEQGRFDNEHQHAVWITRRFGIGKDPVTQHQYEQLMGSNPSHFKNAGPEAPVEQVRWEEAMEFCRLAGEAVRPPARRHASGRQETGESVGSARHAGQRLGVVLGLVC